MCRLRSAGAALLPDDVLAEILGRLPPRGLAVSRAVCKSWRAVVDDGRLLRADLLPLSVGGIFLKFQGHKFPEYFSRPSTNKVSGHMDYLLSLDSIEYHASISGHCNGLVLLDRDDHDFVVNPATRVWAPVPPLPPTASSLLNICHCCNYIAFDPTSSPDYQVVSVPHVKCGYQLPPSVQGAEWPPSSCTMHLLSSRTNQWEERSFAREGKAIATALEMQDTMELPYSAYLNGTLYVCGQRNSVLRMSLTNNKFRAIKPPLGIKENKDYEDTKVYMGKSEKWVYFALLDHYYFQRVWVLNEKCEPMEWLTKHNFDLGNVIPQNCFEQAPRPWVLQDINYNLYRHRFFPNDIKQVKMEEQYEWDSDSDNVLGCAARGEVPQYGDMAILGFHPYKEVIFFGSLFIKRGLAYHMNSSKIQDFGELYPTQYRFFEDMCEDILVSFPYTPCWT